MRGKQEAYLKFSPSIILQIQIIMKNTTIMTKTKNILMTMTNTIMMRKTRMIITFIMRNMTQILP